MSSQSLNISLVSDDLNHTITSSSIHSAATFCQSFLLIPWISKYIFAWKIYSSGFPLLNKGNSKCHPPQLPLVGSSISICDLVSRESTVLGSMLVCGRPTVTTHCVVMRDSLVVTKLSLYLVGVVLLLLQELCHHLCDLLNFIFHVRVLQVLCLRPWTAAEPFYQVFDVILHVLVPPVASIKLHALIQVDRALGC